MKWETFYVNVLRIIEEELTPVWLCELTDLRQT